MIYCVQDPEGGPVKIGQSDNVRLRLQRLSSYYGRPLCLMGTVEGGVEKERSVHARFAEFRVGRAEQFRPHQTIADYFGCTLKPDRPDLDEMLPKSFDPDRDDVVVKVDRQTASRAKAIAKHYGISAAQVISDAAREALGKSYVRMVRESEQEPTP